METYHSPGKLLITGEYAILDGALAFALPTKFGQQMDVEVLERNDSTLIWQAFHQGKLWMSAEINYKNWEIVETDNPKAAAFICRVFQVLAELNPTRFRENLSYSFKTNLEFPANYGLGSSSTLMTNLANWSGADAFILNETALGGSGYDIAVAKEKSALLYQNLESGRKIEKVNYNPDFRNELIFIHLNQKQDSREGINLYKSKQKSAELISQISQISKEAEATQDLEKFSTLMSKHESLLSHYLDLPTVREKFFPDCPVFVKSLGAWGGDFVLSTKFGGFQKYFNDRNFTMIFSYDDLIL